MMSAVPAHARISVLLIEDDTDDHVLAHDLLCESADTHFDLRWVRNVEEGLAAVRESAPDVVLLDYRLGEQTGLDFLARMPVDDPTPVILLTGQGDRETDLRAMQAGAADYLPKSEITPALLERSVRYAIERRRAEVAEREANLRYRTLVESVGAIVWQGDPETFQFTFVSPEAEALLGYPAQRWTANPTFWVDHIHPEDREWAVRLCEEATRKGEPHTFEYRMIAADGRVVWLRDIVRIRHEADGEPQLVGVMTDITERKQAEEALRASEQSYRSLFASLSELVYILSFEGQFLDVNEAVLQRYGYSREEVIGGAPDLLADPEWEGRAEAVASLQRAAAGEPQRFEWWARTKSGEVFLKDVSLTRGEYFGEPVVIAVGRDITERKRAEQQLAAAEAHYRRLVETSPYGVFVLDAHGQFTEVNPAGARIVSRSAREMLGRHFGELIAPEDLETANDAFVRVISGAEETREVELWIQRPSAERRLLNVVITAIRENGEIAGVHGLSRDITEERAREAQMRLLSAALENLEQGVCIQDARDLRVLYANAAHARLFGYDRTQAHEISTAEFLPDAEAEQQLRTIRHTMEETGQWSGRVRRVRPEDGRIVTLKAITGRIQGADHRALIFGVYHDASEEIEAERRLRRVERLASVGTLIGGVAHELNNPLHAIQGFAELMLLGEHGEEDRKDLQTIQREASRAAKIVSDLRQVARQTQGEEDAREAVDLNEVVRHVLKTRRYTLETSNIEVREDLAADLPRVWADRGQIEQVVLNLVVNAEQAMADQDEGRLILRTRASAAGASIHVVDNGPGIAPAHLERIFDPFWTTKAPREGTGLGLSLVHSIVTEHGGELHVDSQVGTGTAFWVDLPRAPEIGPERSRIVQAEIPSEALRVLVVDDEPAIRRALVRYLSRRGHTVEEAAEGGAALRLLDETAYDVILSDLKMPGLGGEALLQHLGERGLSDRVIFLTGHAAGGNARALADTDVPVLLKPVKLEEVARVVEEIGLAAR